MTNDEWFEMAADDCLLGWAVDALMDELDNPTHPALTTDPTLTNRLSEAIRSSWAIGTAIAPVIDPDGSDSARERLVARVVTDRCSELELIALSDEAVRTLVVDRALPDHPASREALSQFIDTEVDERLGPGVVAFFEAGGEIRSDRFGRLELRRPGQEWPTD